MEGRYEIVYTKSSLSKQIARVIKPLFQTFFYSMLILYALGNFYPQLSTLVFIEGSHISRPDTICVGGNLRTVFIYQG